MAICLNQKGWRALKSFKGEKSTIYLQLTLLLVVLILITSKVYLTSRSLLNQSAISIELVELQELVAQVLQSHFVMMRNVRILKRCQES